MPLCHFAPLRGYTDVQMKFNQTADAIAQPALNRASDSISDAALIHRLADSARLPFTDSPAEDALAHALSIAAAAVRRRMGLWRAVLDDPDELSGPVRDVPPARRPASRPDRPQRAHSLHQPTPRAERLGRPRLAPGPT